MAFSNDNPALKLKFPAMKKGAASQAKSASDDDPLGLGDGDDGESSDGGDEVDELFGDAGDSEFDPETPLGDASLEELRAALASKESSQRAKDAKSSAESEPSDSDY